MKWSDWLAAVCHSESLKPPALGWKKHATLLLPPQPPPKEAQHKCSVSSLLWAAAHQHCCDEKHKMRDQRTEWCLLRQACYDTLAVTVSSRQDLGILFFMGNKADTQQTSIPVSWFTPAVLWQKAPENSAARRPASSLLTCFLTEFEIVALRWPHT